MDGRRPAPHLRAVTTRGDETDARRVLGAHPMTTGLSPNMRRGPRPRTQPGRRRKRTLITAGAIAAKAGNSRVVGGHPTAPPRPAATIFHKKTRPPPRNEIQTAHGAAARVRRRRRAPRRRRTRARHGRGRRMGAAGPRGRGGPARLPRREAQHRRLAAFEARRDTRERAPAAASSQPLPGKMRRRALAPGSPPRSTSPPISDGPVETARRVATRGASAHTASSASFA